MSAAPLQSVLEAVLAPVLLAQGKRVRRVTPLLPEPEGPREGGAGPRRLLVVGDSSAAGVGAATWDEALTACLIQRLGGPARWSWQLVARTGWTTPQALRALRAVEGPFDLAITALGVNDVTARTPWAAAAENHRALLDDLTGRLAVPRVVVSALPPIRAFTALPWPLRSVIARRGDGLDALLSRVEEKFPQVSRMRPVDGEPETEMASDGFHPGPGAYAVWANRIAGLLGDQAMDGCAE